MVNENLSQTLIDNNPGLKKTWVKRIQRLNINLDVDGTVSVYYRGKVREGELTYVNFTPCVVIRKPSNPDHFKYFPLPMMEKRYITRDGHKHKKELEEHQMERDIAGNKNFNTPTPLREESEFLRSLGFYQ
jgi:hypothetical protein